MAKKLEDYNKKRDFKKTSEPEGQPAKTSKELRFVVQKHAASRLHFDFRLEQDGVLWSWAVPKGPSYNPKDKRLAVQVEDHPLDYRNFEGTIPKGEYGGGTVMLFDEGLWIPESDPIKGLADGSLKFTLEGTRLKGRWTLIRMKPKDGEEDKNWFLIKEKDDYVKDTDGITTILTSVRSERTMEEIAQAKETEAIASPAKESNDQPSIVPSAVNPVKAASKPNPSHSSPPDLSGDLPFVEVSPMLASLVKTAPPGSNWVHELKLDGYRILAFLEGGKARLLTRNGNDWSHKLPDLVKTLEEWDPGNLILDGEVVVMDKTGKSDFQALQSYFKNQDTHSADYVIFDLLAVGDQDLRKKTLIERKTLLEELLKDSPPGLFYSPHTEGNAIFAKVCAAGMEGIISKKKDSPYRSTRSKDWLKTKCEYRQEFVIGGYTTSDKSSTGLSSLLLGTYDKDILIYKGRAGTGFSRLDSVDLIDQFKPLIRKTSPFTDDLKPRSNETITYLTPKLVAEIQYAEITDDQLLRQASFKGLREDKSALEVISETPTDINLESDDKETLDKKAEKKKAIDKNADDEPTQTKKISDEDETTEQSTKEPRSSKGSPDEDKKSKRPTKSNATKKSKGPKFGQIILSSPTKLVFPEDGFTKQDIADYYWAIRTEILPYVVDRPMTLIRCTDGIGDCFFQKHMNHAIPGMETAMVPDNDGKETQSMVLRDEEGLLGAVQMGTLEFHGWGANLKKIEQPDWLVFDLDPDEGMDLETVRQGVLGLKSILDEMDLVAFLKTSGGKGYHIVVPLTPSADWEQTRSFAKLLAQSMEMKWPDKYTANMRKEKRKGRIYIDWVRNGRSATSVSVFSLRGRKGASISWPIAWSDLDRIAPSQVTLKNWKDYKKTIKSWDDFFFITQRIAKN